MNQDISEFILVDKYRPKRLDDVVLDEQHFLKFKSYIKNKSIPNILFHGPPGTGKTTVARILVESISDSNDILTINGSNNTGIDYIRNHVVEFLSSPSFGDSIRIVHIEEADYLSQNAQGALRNIMDEFDNCRFIFTLNYITKIIEPLQSRFQIFKFQKLPKETILQLYSNIFKLEEITFEKSDIEKIVDLYYPDVRKIGNVLQINTINNKLDLNVINNTTEKLVIEELKNAYSNIKGITASKCKDVNKRIGEILSKSEIDYLSFYEEAFKDPDIPYFVKIKIAKGSTNHSISLQPYLNLMGTLYEIAEVAMEKMLLLKK